MNIFKHSASITNSYQSSHWTVLCHTIFPEGARSEKDGGCPFTTILCELKHPQLGVIPPKTIFKIKLVHGSSEYDFRTQAGIFYQVIDDFLDVGLQWIVVKRAAGHIFRYRELYASITYIL